MVKDIAVLNCVGVLKRLAVSFWVEEKSIERTDRVYLQDGTETECRATVAYRSRGCLYLFSLAETNGSWMFAYAQAWQAEEAEDQGTSSCRFSKI